MLELIWDNLIFIEFVILVGLLIFCVWNYLDSKKQELKVENMIHEWNKQSDVLSLLRLVYDSFYGHKDMLIVLEYFTNKTNGFLISVDFLDRNQPIPHRVTLTDVNPLYFGLFQLMLEDMVKQPIAANVRTVINVTNEAVSMPESNVGILNRSFDVKEFPIGTVV